MPLVTAWWTTYVEKEEEPYLYSCLPKIEENLPSILNACGLFPVDVTSTMQEDLIRRTITVTFYERKKTPEKSGAQ
jgi:hypothetical protein